MKMLRPDIITQQITALALQYPELKDDEDGWMLSVESETDVHDFLRQIERRRQEAAAFAGGIASNIAELELRQQRYENRERAMRSLAFKIMQVADIFKAELPEATMSIRPGTSKVIITNEEAIPDILCRIKREPDKTKLKEHLLNGPIAGAILSNAEPTLSIRTK